MCECLVISLMLIKLSSSSWSLMHLPYVSQEVQINLNSRKRHHLCLIHPKAKTECLIRVYFWFQQMWITFLKGDNQRKYFPSGLLWFGAGCMKSREFTLMMNWFFQALFIKLHSNTEPISACGDLGKIISCMRSVYESIRQSVHLTFFFFFLLLLIFVFLFCFIIICRFLLYSPLVYSVVERALLIN